jgi:nucleotide-binding universal stress UspA family protein
MATTKKILVPVDFSEWSETALAQAEAIARAQNARLLIVHVHEPTAVYTDMGVGAFPVETNREALQGMLEEVRPSDPRIEFEYRLLEGMPAEEIVRLAKEEQVSMIVISTHGRRGIGRMLMGSVAESVVRRATVPVLTVKASAQPMTIPVDEAALSES